MYITHTYSNIGVRRQILTIASFFHQNFASFPLRHLFIYIVHKWIYVCLFVCMWMCWWWFTVTMIYLYFFYSLALLWPFSFCCCCYCCKGETDQPSTRHIIVMINGRRCRSAAKMNELRRSEGQMNIAFVNAPKCMQCVYVYTYK